MIPSTCKFSALNPGQSFLLSNVFYMKTAPFRNAEFALLADTIKLDDGVLSITSPTADVSPTANTFNI